MLPVQLSGFLACAGFPGSPRARPAVARLAAAAKRHIVQERGALDVLKGLVSACTQPKFKSAPTKDCKNKLNKNIWKTLKQPILFKNHCSFLYFLIAVGPPSTTIILGKSDAVF